MLSKVVVLPGLVLAVNALAFPHSSKSLITRDGSATATRHDFANVNSGASCHPPDADIAGAYTGRLGNFNPDNQALVAMGFEGQSQTWRDIKGRPSFCYHEIWVQGPGERVNVLVVDTFGNGLLDLSEFAWLKIFGNNGGDRSPTTVEWGWVGSPGIPPKEFCQNLPSWGQQQASTPECMQAMGGSGGSDSTSNSDGSGSEAAPNQQESGGSKPNPSDNSDDSDGSGGGGSGPTSSAQIPGSPCPFVQSKNSCDCDRWNLSTNSCDSCDWDPERCQPGSGQGSSSSQQQGGSGEHVCDRNNPAEDWSTCCNPDARDCSYLSR